MKGYAKSALLLHHMNLQVSSTADISNDSDGTKNGSTESANFLSFVESEVTGAESSMTELELLQWYVTSPDGSQIFLSEQTEIY